MKKKPYFSRKNYPDITQQNKLFMEKLDELDKLIEEKQANRTMILSKLRRAVVLVTESLKVGEEKDQSTLVPSASYMSGNLFHQLYEILTSTEEIEMDEQQSDEVDVQQSTLNVRY